MEESRRLCSRPVSWVPRWAGDFLIREGGKNLAEQDQSTQRMTTNGKVGKTGHLTFGSDVIYPPLKSSVGSGDFCPFLLPLRLVYSFKMLPGTQRSYDGGGLKLVVPAF